MMAAGGYLLMNQVQVTTTWWSFGGQGSFGLSLLPLLAGIAFLFFNGKSFFGWLLTAVGAVIILAGVLMHMDIYFRQTSLFNTLVMLGLLFGGLGLVDRHRQMNRRWRHARAVELQHGRLQHFRLGAGQRRRIGDELDALDNAPAAHGEHLDGASARPDLETEDVAVAELRRRQLLLPVAERLHGPHCVAKLRRLGERVDRRLMLASQKENGAEGR